MRFESVSLRISHSTYTKYVHINTCAWQIFALVVNLRKIYTSCMQLRQPSGDRSAKTPGIKKHEIMPYLHSCIHTWRQLLLADGLRMAEEDGPLSLYFAETSLIANSKYFPHKNVVRASSRVYKTRVRARARVAAAVRLALLARACYVGSRSGDLVQTKTSSSARCFAPMYFINLNA